MMKTIRLTGCDVSIAGCFCAGVFLMLLHLSTAGIAFSESADSGIRLIPTYILRGLRAYETTGYEAAVRTWFEDSPWANAATIVARNNYLKNIEMLYGKYKGYAVVTTKETRYSQMTYIRFDYERMSDYALFTSMMRNNQWVLSGLDLHTRQKMADTP